MRPDVFGLFLFVGVPWVLGWIAKTGWAHQRQMKALELRAEANARLLDRFGSDPSFLEFLKGDGVNSLFDVSVPDPNRSLPYIRMLTAIQAGLLLVGAGIACTWFGDRIAPTRDSEPFMFFGAMGLALGVGSMLSAVAALVVGRLWPRLHNDGARSHVSTSATR